MTVYEQVATAATAAILARQFLILTAIIRSTRFLGQPHVPGAANHENRRLVFFIVLPVLRESAVIADAVTHFRALAKGHAAQIIVVTTERESVEAPSRGGDGDTVALARQFARSGEVVHLHYPDPLGLKGDQLNFAAQHCASNLLGDIPPEQAFLVCYDADSRPPLDSLDHFQRALTTSGEASVLHQSSRFELRASRAGHRPGIRSWLSGGLGEGAALRANRFVLGFEIPRLVNRSERAGRFKRRLCSYVYAHVTGHGLCARLSLLLTLPFPARSPLEDMHYSFYLGSRNLPIIAVPSLDRAEVPATIRTQLDQAARWFFGPARYRRYLRDPATRSGPRALLMAASALGSALEWLGCAVVPAAMALLLAAGPGPARWTAAAVAVTYCAQLVITDAAVGAPAPWVRRVIRALACPLATTLFGVGGFAGMIRLLRGESGVGKTERQ